LKEGLVYSLFLPFSGDFLRLEGLEDLLLGGIRIGLEGFGEEELPLFSGDGLVKGLREVLPYLSRVFMEVSLYL
jgi:hypothetical protein